MEPKMHTIDKKVQIFFAIRIGSFEFLLWEILEEPQKSVSVEQE